MSTKIDLLTKEDFQEHYGKYVVCYYKGRIYKGELICYRFLYDQFAFKPIGHIEIKLENGNYTRFDLLEDTNCKIAFFNFTQPMEAYALTIKEFKQPCKIFLSQQPELIQIGFNKKDIRITCPFYFNVTKGCKINSTSDCDDRMYYSECKCISKNEEGENIFDFTKCPYCKVPNGMIVEKEL